VNEYRPVPLRFERLKIEEMLERSRAATRQTRRFPTSSARAWTRS